MSPSPIFSSEQLHWFKSLEMEPTTDSHLVRVAFIKLAKRYHPDRNPSPESQQRFHAASAAKKRLLEFLQGHPVDGVDPLFDILDKTGIIIPLSLAFHGGKHKIPGIGRDVYVTVPAGSISRGMVRMEDGSERMVNIHVQDDAVFRRRGYDLHYDAHMPVMDAMLGAVLDVKLLDGGVFRLMIPAGTGEDVMLKIRGRGLPCPGKEPGDLMVHVKLVLPTQMNEEQQQVAQLLQALLSGRSLSEALVDERPGIARLARRLFGTK